MEQQEEFRPVAGYEGKYEVSNFGRVKSLPKHNQPERFVGGRTAIGYKLVGLYRNNKPCYKYVHQLVCEAFINKPQTKNPLCVNHIDGNKGNNHVSNLEWCTHTANMKHAVATGLKRSKGEDHPLSKLDDETVIKIRELYHTHSSGVLAQIYGISKQYIKQITKGERWAHLPIETYSKGRSSKIHLGNLGLDK